MNFERFRIVHVDVPNAGFCVRDNCAIPVRLHANGILYNRRERHAPHSSYYATRAEAEALRVWLVDRYNRYLFNPLLAEAP